MTDDNQPTPPVPAFPAAPEQPAGPPSAEPQPAGYGQNPYAQGPAGYGYPYPDPYGPQPKSRTVAGLLGIFLGGFGIHRFYLGFIGLGIAQLLLTLFTFGLGSLWGFIEGILYLTGSGNFTRDATGRPLRD